MDFEYSGTTDVKYILSPNAREPLSKFVTVVVTKVILGQKLITTLYS